MLNQEINTGLKIFEIEKIHSILKLHPEVEEAIIYGSRAKGNFKPYSDIDLTLIGSNLTLTIQQKIENELDDLLLPYKFDFSIYDHIHNQDLKNHIDRVGKIFFKLQPATNRL